MGAVYLARHKILKRLEALKVVQPHLTDRPEYVARFYREIEAAGSLDHPNIVPAYAAMKTASGLVLVMKYVEGQDLRRRVKGRGPLPVAVACGYALQAARGLQHAHEQKIVHRDIKPANLMLARTGADLVVKILDFGLAKFARELDTDLTSPLSDDRHAGFYRPGTDARRPQGRHPRRHLQPGLHALLPAQRRPPFRASSLGNSTRRTGRCRRGR